MKTTYKGTEIELWQAVQFIEYEFPLEVRQYFERLEGGVSNVDGVIIKDKFHIFHQLHLHKEKIRQFQKQQPIQDMFVKPEALRQDNIKYHLIDGKGNKIGWDYRLFNKDLQQWENWQPVFFDCSFATIPNEEIMCTLDELIGDTSWWGALDSTKQLFWNPNHEKVKDLFYPDIN